MKLSRKGTLVSQTQHANAIIYCASLNNGTRETCSKSTFPFIHVLNCYTVNRCMTNTVLFSSSDVSSDLLGKANRKRKSNSTFRAKYLKNVVFLYNTILDIIHLHVFHLKTRRFGDCQDTFLFIVIAVRT